MKLHLPCQMKSADLPVSIHPDHHFAHHHILFQSAWLAYGQGFSASSHLKIKSEMSDDEKKGPNLKHGKGGGHRVVMHCQRNWVPLMDGVHSY